MLAGSLGLSADPTSPGTAVDPMIGTDHDGQTFPAAGMPFGMTHWTPQTRATEDKCVSPYYYKDSRIQGFRGSHWWSGSCSHDFGSVTIMAETGPLKTDAVARASSFRRERESATPWAYSVLLEDYGIEAEVTAGRRAGVLRFSFPEAEEAYILVHPNSLAAEGHVQIDPRRNEISGFNPVHRIYAGNGKLAGISGYFVARFSRPISSYGTWAGGERHAGSPEQSGDAGQPGAYIRFATHTGDRVEVRVGTSFTSVEEARKNLESEIGSQSFEQVRDTARAAWEAALSRIEIQGASETQRQIFYTALYHALLMPSLYSDADGSYPRFASMDGRIETARGFEYYDDYSTWDTFRALHPLLTVLDPERSKDMAQSLVVKGQQGGWLPAFPGWNNYTAAMIGDHGVPIIVDAYMKGIRGFDAAEAYRLMRKNATETPSSFAEYVDGKGRRALASYLKFGFIPVEDPVKEAFHTKDQVSRTVEYAYDDFNIAQMAGALGKREDEQMFLQRARNYRNVFDRSIGFARPRHEDGSFETPFDPAKPSSGFTEGTSWQYSLFAPHDMPGLIELMGGRQALVERLDTLFAKNYYEHGNEPSHHIAYLYDYAGAPWKTQERVRKILESEYTSGPAGLSGNDDAGQMSAWYVLSALGIYPVCPGFPSYEIGSPLFREAAVHLSNGKTFRIRAEGVSASHVYIQSATLDGKPYLKPWVTHQDIVRGATLSLKMGSRPNPSWGSAMESTPPSIPK
ncbi:MAG: GH92 family glycosyl hydrolase [Candidatus Solibacter sp.]